MVGAEVMISAPKDMSSIPPGTHSFIFSQGNLRKIPEMSSGIEECKIPTQAGNSTD